MAKKKTEDNDTDNIAPDHFDKFSDDAESVKYQVIEYGPNSPQNSERPGQSPAGGVTSTTATKTTATQKKVTK